jgi:phosphatidylglycerophosphate synthase
MPPSDSITRRPLTSRDTLWAARIAGGLARLGVRPNTVSVFGAIFAAGSGACLYFAGRVPPDWREAVLLVGAVVGMQARLLCNLFDGMIAIEGGQRTKSGELFNELPDRFSDAFILIGAACATPQIAFSHVLGWCAAVLALITAYVRALGASMGAGQQFAGPMAKPQRMATMTVACLIAAFSPMWPALAGILPLALGVVAVGCVVTIFRRCALIVRELESK